jgi:hypothetical protein
MDRPDSFREVEEITNADEVQRLSCADALQNDSRNLWLFTPALLITHGGFDRDPVQEFDARFPLSADQRPFCVQLTRDNEQFFDGLGVRPLAGRTPVNWDQRLYAIDEKHAQDCFDFLSGIAWSDPARGYFANTMSYDMLIPDPTSKRGAVLPVKVFGVMANTLLAYLEERPGRRPLARAVPMLAGALPASLPRTNLLGVTPKEDPLNMRED